MAFVNSGQNWMYWGIIGSAYWSSTITQNFTIPVNVWSYPVLQNLSLGSSSYVNTFISGYTDASGPHSNLRWIGAYINKCSAVTFWMEMSDAVAGASAITMFYG